MKEDILYIIRELGLDDEYYEMELCKYLSHNKSQYHKADEPCPPYQDIKVRVDKIKQYYNQK